MRYIARAFRRGASQELKESGPPQVWRGCIRRLAPLLFAVMLKCPGAPSWAFGRFPTRVWAPIRMRRSAYAFSLHGVWKPLGRPARFGVGVGVSQVGPRGAFQPGEVL